MKRILATVSLILSLACFAGSDAIPPSVAEGMARVRAAGVQDGEFTTLDYEDGYLRVAYVLKPSTSSYIRCELALPDADRWDGRLWGHGNGGWAGRVLCLRGMDGDTSAHAQCDMGTSRCQKGPFPANPEVIRDFAGRATHLMTVSAKRFVLAYYGKKPHHCYFRGASTGGGQAIGEALNYPEDYDGIISGVPVVPRFPRAAFVWNVARLKQKHGTWFSAAEQQAIRAAELKFFARSDPEWARGNFIVDPRATPEKIDGCWREIVTANPALADRESLWRELFEPVVIRGRTLAPSISIGSEFAVGWAFMFDRTMGRKPIGKITEDDLIAFAKRPDINYDNPDLSAFKAHGGKIIMFGGYEDASCPAAFINSYYDRVIAKMGGIAGAQSFFVYYAEPGRSHGAQGAPSGVGQIGNPPDVAEKLIAWVENKTYPGNLSFTWQKALKQLSIAPYPDCRVTCVDGSFAERLDAAFAIDRARSIISPNDLGLVNGHLTLNGRVEDVSLVRGIYAPPYFCNDFVFALHFNGHPVAATDYTWRPEALTRRGSRDGWEITTRLVPVAGEREAMLEVAVRNGNARPADLSLQYVAYGNVGRRERWGFGKPTRESVLTNGTMEIDSGKPARIAIRWSLGDDKFAQLTKVPAGAKRTFYVALALGEPDSASHLVRAGIADPDGVVARSVAGWKARVRRLATRMPDFDCDDPALVQLYRRSLLHLLLVEWNVGSFKLRPYYATGGLNGGCLCNYLWNFGGPHRLWPLLDPAALKEHVRAFLNLDLEKCYAFAPNDGSPQGPYYPINQEKMLFLIDSLVRETGDVAFLRETYRGRTMVEWALQMALTHDDLTKEAVLHDYGASNSHLELRTGNDLYNGVMPDLNLRRVRLLRMADRLCKMAGYDPKVDLNRRAEALKALCRHELWDEKAGWFKVRCADGQTKLRWTMQMFKAFGGGALDEDVEKAMLGHLMNENEFLGSHGVHSLSKRDPAYDGKDIDNGGPGACPSFAPAICDRLYADGHAQEANEILMRLRWLGSALPYFGDSQYADRTDYRRDTPLQCDVEGACLAQTIVFGLFGVTIDDAGRVAFDPHLPRGVNRMKLTNLRLRGKCFTVTCTREGGTVVEE